MRLLTTSYRYGYSCDRRGSNAGVRSRFLPPIPGWEVKTCHYTHHTAHRFATDHPRGRIRQGPYPTISGIRPYPPVLDPSSTRPRPSLDPAPVSRGERPTRHRAQGLFTVSSPTSPWCPGMAGHSWGTSLQPPPQGSTKLHLKAPRRPDLLLPYKRAGQGSTRGDERTNKGNNEQTNDTRQDARQKPRSTSKGSPPTDQHLKQSLLYSHFSFETWAQFPLSQLVTPTQAFRCKEIQYSLLPAGRRAFFCPNQDKSPCILLASPSRLGTRSTHSLA
jgi:hypothetical protein